MRSNAVAPGGTGTIHYTDGSAQSFAITLPNWIGRTPTAGDLLVANTSYGARRVVSI